MFDSKSSAGAYHAEQGDVVGVKSAFDQRHQQQERVHLRPQKGVFV